MFVAVCSAPGQTVSRDDDLGTIPWGMETLGYSRVRHTCSSLRKDQKRQKTNLDSSEGKLSSSQGSQALLLGEVSVLMSPESSPSVTRASVLLQQPHLAMCDLCPLRMETENPRVQATSDNVVIAIETLPSKVPPQTIQKACLSSISQTAGHGCAI